MTFDDQQLRSFMKLSLEQAHLAAALGEVPIGATAWKDGRLVAANHNRTETEFDATAHAEMLVIREASKLFGNWRLEGLVLCVTLEPCAMCLGAIRLARIPYVVYGAGDSRFGAVKSFCTLTSDTRVGPAPEIVSGILEQECAQILKDFFKARR